MMNKNYSDQYYMSRALRLASRGEGFTSPNPMVGAVIVKDERIVGEGFHCRVGMPHAETVAIEKAGSNAREAILYVNLEPCNHFGKTPPCTDAIIKSGIKKVIASIRDPNPDVEVGGIEKLRNNGIEVELGLLENKARILNEKYLYFVTHKLPFVIIKVGATLDGKIATRTGDSQWITSEKARNIAHKIRQSVDGIAVGIETVLKDNPRLTVRIGSGNFYSNRIVFDTHLITPINADILSPAYKGKTFIITSENIHRQKEKEVINVNTLNTEIIKVPLKNDHLSIMDALSELAKRNITSIMVEGGGKLIASFIKEKAAQKMIAILAPKIIGGKNGVPMVDDIGTVNLNDSIVLKNVTWKKIGDEIMFTGYF